MREGLEALVRECRDSAAFAKSEQMRYARVGAITALAHQRIHESLNSRHADQLEAVLKEEERGQEELVGRLKALVKRWQDDSKWLTREGLRMGARRNRSRKDYELFGRAKRVEEDITELEAVLKEEDLWE